MGMITPPETPVARRYRRLRIPDNVHWLAAVNGVLAEMMNTHFWEQIDPGDLTQAEAAAAARQMFIDYREDGDDWSMAGRIFAWQFPTPPKNAVLCDGSFYFYDQYPELGALFGALPGQQFAVPDLQARMLVGTGQYPMSADPDDDVSIFLGATHNAKGAVVLTTGQLPPHAHTTNPHSHVDAGHTHAEGIAAPSVQEVTVGVPAPAAVPAVGATGIGFASIQPETVTVNNTGNGEWVDIRPRWFGIEWWMSTR